MLLYDLDVSSARSLFAQLAAVLSRPLISCFLSGAAGVGCSLQRSLPETPPPDWGLEGAREGCPQGVQLLDITNIRL